MTRGSNLYDKLTERVPVRLIGLCVSQPSCEPDVSGMLGVVYSDGTGGIHSGHISSNEAWSEIDIEGHRNRSEFSELPYEWIGLVTHEEPRTAIFRKSE